MLWKRGENYVVSLFQSAREVLHKYYRRIFESRLSWTRGKIILFFHRARHPLLLVWRMVMKILLVNPEFPDTYWSFRHALPFEGKRCAFPPLGLLTVSAMLPQSWERRLIDLNVESLKAEDIEWADMVLATAMLAQKESLHVVVKRCKKLGKRVVLGGPYVTSTIEDLPDADHLFLGEAETTLPE